MAGESLNPFRTDRSGMLQPILAAAAFGIALVSPQIARANGGGVEMFLFGGLFAGIIALAAIILIETPVLGLFWKAPLNKRIELLLVVNIFSLLAGIPYRLLAGWLAWEVRPDRWAPLRNDAWILTLALITGYFILTVLIEYPVGKARIHQTEELAGIPGWKRGILAANIVSYLLLGSWLMWISEFRY